jgi:RNA polymerase sigma-70 factor (ECF subfamily)
MTVDAKPVRSTSGPPASNALTSVVRLHGVALFRRALKLTRAHADASDLVQDTLVRAIDHGLDVESDEDAKRWLFVVMWHLHVDRRRRSHGCRTIPLDAACLASLATTPPPPAPLWHAFDYDDVRRCLPRLGPRVREAYVLHEELGLSLADTARRLAVPVGTASTRVFRARRSLRAMLCGYRSKGNLTTGEDGDP